MLALTTAQRTALAQLEVMRRIFVWFDVLDSLGASAAAGFWDDVGEVTIGGRTYYGSGLVNIGNVPSAGDMSVGTLPITISGVSQEGIAMVRGAKIKQRPVEVHFGIYDTGSKEIIGDLIPRFFGKIDDYEIVTPQAGEESVIEIRCESVSRNLTIARTDTRSDACHKTMWPSDDGMEYVGVQRKPVFFGSLSPEKAAKRAKRSKK